MNYLSVKIILKVKGIYALFFHFKSFLDFRRAGMYVSRFRVNIPNVFQVVKTSSYKEEAHIICKMTANGLATRIHAQINVIRWNLLLVNLCHVRIMLHGFLFYFFKISREKVCRMKFTAGEPIWSWEMMWMKNS